MLLVTFTARICVKESKKKDVVIHSFYTEDKNKVDLKKIKRIEKEPLHPVMAVSPQKCFFLMYFFKL